MRNFSIFFAAALSLGTAACVSSDSPAEPPDGPACTALDASAELRDACGRCDADVDCASGSCLETTGVCAPPERVVYVTASPSGADVGACTMAAPCRTLQYALRQVASARDVIRLDGPRLVTASPVVIDRPVTIDARGTRIAKPGGLPAFIVERGVGPVTLEGLALEGSAGFGQPAVTVAPESWLRIAGSVLASASVYVDGGRLELLDSQVSTEEESFHAVRCAAGAVRVRGVHFERATVMATGCDVEVARSRFEQRTDGSVSVNGGRAVIENNVIATSNEYADAMFVANVAPGSAVRFNTFVNTSGVDSDGVALYCDGTSAVSSNIFAYRSKHPLGPPLFHCPATYSLFDEVAEPAQTLGTGNVVAPGATFFANAAAGDYRPACDSPAKDAAQPGLPVTEDFDGRRRYLASRGPDIGAFELR